MNQISVKTLFLIALLGVIVANAVSLPDWIADGDALELCESEKKEAEKEELKTEKDEICLDESKHAFSFLLIPSPPDKNEIDPHSIQCREILTPPPDFS